MARKTKERVVFEEQIKTLRECAEAHRKNATAEEHLSKEAESTADLLQKLLNQAEEELKKQGAAKAGEEEDNGEEEAEEDPF